MLVGLQGSGKTSTAGKLGALLKKQGRRPLLVAADIYRPAAIKQLQVLGKQLDLTVFSLEGAKPPQIALQAVEYTQSCRKNAVIIDTAGRLHINEELMQELKDIKAGVVTMRPSLVGELHRSGCRKDCRQFSGNHWPNRTGPN